MGFKSYEEYLLSNKWQKVKEDFKEFSERASGICFLCYEKDGLQLHHWRYPKNWNNDSHKNLIELCCTCHETLHSVEHSKLLHNSYLFDTNSDKDLIKYLSWVIKATSVMDLVYMENLSNEF